MYRISFFVEMTSVSPCRAVTKSSPHSAAGVSRQLGSGEWYPFAPPDGTPETSIVREFAAGATSAASVRPARRMTLLTPAAGTESVIGTAGGEASDGCGGGGVVSLRVSGVSIAGSMHAHARR